MYVCDSGKWGNNEMYTGKNNTKRKKTWENKDTREEVAPVLRGVQATSRGYTLKKE